MCVCFVPPQCWRCRWEGWSAQVPGGSSPSRSKLSSARGPTPASAGAPNPCGSRTATSAVAAPPSTWAGPSFWLAQRRGRGAGGRRRVDWWPTAPLWLCSGGNTGTPNSGASGGRTRGAAVLWSPQTNITTMGGPRSPSQSTSPLISWLRKTLSLTGQTHTLPLSLSRPRRPLRPLWFVQPRILTEPTGDVKTVQSLTLTLRLSGRSTKRATRRKVFFRLLLQPNSETWHAAKENTRAHTDVQMFI